MENRDSTAGRTAGRIISALVVAFLVVASAAPKLIGHPSATESFVRFGFDRSVTLPIGLLETTCAVLYAIPGTSVLGAVLMTGLLGGATATQLRIGDPWFLFPVAVGIAAWIGLFLRERRLRDLVPIRIRRSPLRD